MLSLAIEAFDAAARTLVAKSDRVGIVTYGANSDHSLNAVRRRGAAFAGRAPIGFSLSAGRLRYPDDLVEGFVGDEAQRLGAAQISGGRPWMMNAVRQMRKLSCRPVSGAISTAEIGRHVIQNSP